MALSPMALQVNLPPLRERILDFFTPLRFREIRASFFTESAMSTESAVLQEEPLPAARSLAGDIRALRKARGLTLTEIGARLKRSVGWLSQVERGISLPSLADLRAFADIFGVPLGLFFGHDAESDEERGVVVRAGRRRSLGTSESGLVEELLSPDLGGSFEMLRSVFAPGAELAETALRKSEEAGYVVSGRFDIEIDGVWHRLGRGDSFRFAAKPFRWKNPGKEPAVVIWVVSPPVY
jgi:transcriptional regulator with XRE-family HTH domain